MSKKKPTQAELLLDYLKTHEYVGRYEAMYHIGIANITAVISILRKQGFNVVADIHKATNRYDRPVHYATWRLVEEDTDSGNQEFSN
jgi:hypothetical protein